LRNSAEASYIPGLSNQKKFLQKSHLILKADEPLYKQLIDAATETRVNKLSPILLNGFIDLVFKEPAGWIIVDYKTDCPKYEKDYDFLKKKYQPQIDVYGYVWEKLSGGKVNDKIIYFISR